MKIGLNKKQRKELDVNGFTIIEKILDCKTITKVSKAMDLIAEKILKYRGTKPGYIDGQFYGDGVKLRNCVSHNEHILNLIDHTKNSAIDCRCNRLEYSK